VPLNVSQEYFNWPSVVTLSQILPISGLQEMRHSAFLDIDRDKLEKRMRAFLNPDTDWNEIKALGTGLTKKAGGFQPLEARKKAHDSESYQPEKLRRYALYPFDNRWCYYTVVPTLWNRPRPELVAQSWPGNKFFLTRMFAERPSEQITMTVTGDLPDYHLLRPNAVAIPLQLRDRQKVSANKKKETNGEFSNLLQEVGFTDGLDGGKITANLSSSARAYLAKIGIANPDADAETAALLWMHALAIGYPPAYVTDNADGIKQDWPRIPLPKLKASLLSSVALGKQIALLLDIGTVLVGVDSGKIRPELIQIAKVARISGDTLNLSVTSGWGHAGKEGVTMPGKGKLIERTDFDDTLSPILGNKSFDIYLNNTACWQNVPVRVWEYTIGGYQVIKKWLSYREYDLLGRALTPEEAREVTNMARRIAALILLQPELDKNYEVVKATSIPLD
jgi:hypothetical protein